MEARGSALEGPEGSAAVAKGFSNAAAAAETHSSSIAGVYVEASGKTLSLFDASREHLLQPDLVLALLEAQAATGGLLDPARKQWVSVAEALRMGLVGLEMKERLLCAERAVTGFIDPYTEKKISLYQAIQKELVGRDRGLRLLEAQVATGGIIDPLTGHRVPLPEACARGYLDEELSNFLSGPREEEEVKGFWDPNDNQKVTYLELMRRCIVSPATGLLLLPLKISFSGLRGRAICSHELLDSGIIDSTTFKALHDGEVTAQEVAEMDTVQQYLSGANGIAGMAILHTGESKSLYQALSEHILMPGLAEILLQAQAATGGLVDPGQNKSFTVDEAVRAGLVGPELYQKLSFAEKAVTGYKDPYIRETLSLFQAMKKGLVPRNPGIFLLEAQLTTGGIIDPHAHHRLPVEVACQRGHLDRDMYYLLCNPSDNTRGYFEPNSKQNMSYAELLASCVIDPGTGLCLLPLFGDLAKEHHFIDQRTQRLLRSTVVPKPCGPFQGRPVSLWKLLFSGPLAREQRRALAQHLCSSSLSAQELVDRITQAVQQASANLRVTFEGLRDKVTPSQLLSSEIINEDLFEKLTHGETLVKDVMGVGTVKKYLEGTGSIAGLLLPESQEKISVYQAKRKGLLRPGTSLILLEAQAATGYIIDPANNKKYSVDEALRAHIIGPDVYDKLRAAEKAVTGYRDPYTGGMISLFQAMKKGLIVHEHAVRLLEAQIATGGIIDPVNSHRLPVEAAYKRGYFDKRMNLILSDPRDDTKGFFDPNTHENLTYLQLKEKCVTEPPTGLCLLPLYSKKRPFVDDATKQAFQNSWLFIKHGRFKGQRVSVWDLLNSEYFSEGKRREILHHYGLRKITLEQLRLLLEEEMKKWARIKFPVIRGSVTAYHLVETGVINRDLFEKLLEGTVSPEEVLRMDCVRKYLYGTGSIGGIVLQPSHERVSLYEAMKRDIVLPGLALPLLEAQAATGFIIDPVNNHKLCLDDAVKQGVIGPELYEKLHQAEEAITGYNDPFTGKKISLFQAMKKGLVADKQAMQLMDAQLSAGGVFDPQSGHYVPVDVAQKKGFLDEDFHKALSNPSSDTKAFSTLDQKEKVTYGQLINRCKKDEASGVHLLPLSQAASLVYTQEQMEQCFRETFLEDRAISLWELINSGYFTEEQRRELYEKFKSGAISLQQLVSLVQGLIKEIEMKAQTQVSFQGLRGSVPAVWLLDAGIISEETFAELAQGQRTAREVAEMESVKKYLQGTGSIAGVFLPDSKEKMNLYQAVQSGFLLPGLGTRLLEAQAATGSIIDPETNRKLTVEEAIKAGLVGEELMEQLLQAERALAGYPDPYSGNPISVCQAIRKELIPARTGIPLLEAQLATGGIIDPVHHHHLPLQAAYRYGFYDEDMHKTLSQPTEETCVFFDPNTQESLTYQQLKGRCHQDPATGLLLLTLSTDAALHGDWQTMEVLKSVPVCVNIGRFKGQEVSLWDLLNSEYISKPQRRELVLTYKEKDAEALQEMTAAITRIIEETEQQGKRFTFKGLRKQVSATDLFQSQLIDKGTLDDLRQGKTTVQEVTNMDSVRQYLEGSNFIAGVLLQPNHERLSIYQAMRQGLLRPGAALVLLEAQAATGFLIDPVENKRLSVDEAVAAGMIGREIHDKLLSAEKAVTGYTHPYTKKKISLFEAMKEELIVQSHGIRLLEAQVATGGIIDPIHSHRIPVEVAYKRGYFDEKLNQILLDPTDDTKGFFDPNTHENLTYLQLLERCVQDPKTGLYMLQIVQRGGRYFYIDEATKQFLKSQPMHVRVGRYKGQKVSMWDLLCSPYIHEQKRKDLVSQYKVGSLTLEQLSKALNTVVEETEQEAQKFKLEGLRGKVSAADLFNSEIIDKTMLDTLRQGPGALRQLAQKDSIQQFLKGTGCISGVLAKGQKMTLCEAMQKGLLLPENGLMLLEALAATGFMTGPTEKPILTVDQAASAGLVGEDLQARLHLAEEAVTGYTDPVTGDKMSLYQAMKRNLVEKGFALRLLEAQVATGGIIDPSCGHRIPVEVACKRGHLDDDIFLLLSDAEYAKRGFVDPNTQERITYAHLLERSLKDSDSGTYLLPLLDKKEYFYIDEVTKTTLSSTKVNVAHGKFRGQTLSLWQLLSSEYIHEEKKKELVKKYKEQSSAVLQQIINHILNIVKEKERSRQDIWFQGLRKQVTASELLEADIIGKDTMKNLKEGTQRPQDVARMDSVKRYLEGTGSIAGVLVPSRSDPAKTEKMTIYQAMWKGILRPGTALVLLEAQAATGFIIDPLKNAKFSVSEAISAGLVGGEIQNKLLSAEKAVIGYTDPNNGRKISLFQAMKTDLILKEHGIRLLEAQIATGGIIDPVLSHRLPVEVAYKRGYFDEEMNQILTDPTEDTKGFFDPNTHENLTYKQLLQRCICDPDTGLKMLNVQDQRLNTLPADESMRKTLQLKTTTAEMGTVDLGKKEEALDWEGALRTQLIQVSLPEFQDRRLSVWDLLYSQYISESQREDLLSKYRTGTMTLEELANVLAALLAKATPGKCRHPTSPEAASPDKDDKERSEEDEEEKERDSVALGEKEEALKSRIVHVVAGELRGQKVSVYHLLYSKYMPKGKRKELLQLYRSGILSTDQMETVVTTIVNKMGEEEEAKEEGPGDASREGTLPEAEGPSLSGPDDQLETALRQVKVNVPVGELQGDQHSLWELLFSKHISTEKRIELLEKYRAGHVNTEELARLVLVLIEEMEEKSSRLKFSGLRRQVTASELFQAQIIDQETLSKLTHGDKTVEEITEMDTVKRYLEGTGCIAGVLVPARSDPAKTEKMTIYQAMWKGILRPGTALVLLEAQAATGFITDPLENRKLSVDEAVAAGVVGAELREKLLSAERAVTGYKDPYTGSSLSLFQALQKDLIVRDHGVRLLEAQIATGGIIDPIHSHRLPVEVAYQRGFFDEEMNRTLSDPTDDTKGFFDPNTHENLTYNQLLCRCLPDPETGLLMLHLMERSSSSFLLNENTRKALQSAMTRMEVGLFQGQEVSVWDLLFSRYVPPERRGELLRQYKTGTLALEGLTQILTTTILETEGRSHKPDGQQGAPVRPLATSPRESTGHAHGEEAWKELLRSTAVSLNPGEHQGHPMVVWDLLFSDYIWEEKRAELLDMYRRGLLSMDRLINVLTTLVQKKQSTTRKMEVKVKSPHQEVDPGLSSPDGGNWEGALRTHLIRVSLPEFQDRRLSVWDLLYSQFISESQREELLSKYRTGTMTLEELANVLAALLAKATPGKCRHPTSPEAASPDKDAKERSEEDEEEKDRDSVALGEKEEALKSRIVHVVAGELRGQKVSVYHLLYSKYMPKGKRKELLQLYRSGILSTDQMETVVTTIVNKMGEEEEAKEEGPGDASREGTLPEAEGPSLSGPDDQLETALRQVKVNVPVGELQGDQHSLWELLFSKHISTEKRIELLEKYRAGHVNTEELARLVLVLIEEMEEKSSRLKFSGLRRQVTASELFQAQIIDQETLSKLTHGDKTVEEITEMDTVKRYLEGTGCIAGVLVPARSDPAKTEKMTIYQAMWKGILRPGTALVLLEAQAATGFITDPLENRKLSVDEAVAAGVVGAELREKLLSAERAVTGYKDPYTGSSLSLFQALQKDLIVRDHGVRLLEAQIATGGIIDPIHSHRLPVEVAYQRGFFDEEMNRTLSDPTDDTKGFFDPNTHENLTYNQLLCRCLPDPETGLLMLHLMERSSSSFLLNENTRKALQSAMTRMEVGLFQGQEVSVWDLLFSRYVPPERRGELLWQYKTGTLALEGLTQILTTTILETEGRSHKPDGQQGAPVRPLATSPRESTGHAHGEEAWKELLRSTAVSLNPGEHQGHPMVVWDLLFSDYIWEEKRAELLDMYRRGLLSMDRLINVLTTLVQKKQSTTRKMEVKVKSPHQEVDPGLSSPDGGNWEGALRTHLIRVSLPEFQDRRLSVWDLLYSQFISESQREELLSKYRTGTMTLEELANVLAALLAKATPGKCRHPTSPEAASPDKDAKERSEEDEEEKDRDSVALGEKEEALKSRIVHVVAGELRGQKVSVYHLLYSKYMPKGKRKELLQLYRSGILSTDQMETVVTTIVNKMGEEEEAKEEGPGDASREGTLPEAEGPSLSGPDDQLETALRQVKVNVPVGELQGDQHSLWELLFSKHISTEKRIELLEKYRAGHVNTEELARLVLVLIEEMEEKSSRLKFSGLRRQVTASELFQAQIIDQETLSKLTHGDKTVEEITEMDTVKRYLEGTGCIAGVLVPARSDPAKTEKMTIYQAMWKGILRPGTALVLLEAQAATGFITDPLENRKLSVDEAVAAGVVGAELREKLLSAERAVTGYKDPYTGSSLSLFQALQKDLIVRDHGVRLLEAQIATGGIIDPIHSHRLPVEVAYQRGFFDEEMNRTLSDPTDDTKGFFDPNTHENLTYNQLLCRCLPDPETGLLMLHLMERSSSSFLLNENTRKALQSAMTRMEVGLFQGQEVSVWDLLFSRYVPPERRGELLRQYKTGTLALEGLTQILTTTILETEGRSHKPDGQQGAPVRPLATSPRESTGHAHGEEAWKELLRSTAVSLNPGEHQGHPMVVWDLLFSDYIWEEKRAELLDMYRRGLLSMDRLINVLTTLVQKKQSTTRKMEVKVKSPHQEVDPGLSSPDGGNWEGALRTHLIRVSLPEFQDRRLSVWDLLYSQYISESQREELLSKYRTGTMTLEELANVLAALLAKATPGKCRHPTSPEAASPDKDAKERSEEDEEEKDRDSVALGEKEEALKSRIVHVVAGELRGQKVSVYHLLYSKYMPKGKRKELLQLYRSGILSTDQMETVVTTIVNKMGEEEEAKEEGPGDASREGTLPEAEGPSLSGPDDQLETALRQVKVNVPVGELQGDQHSLWELLFSKHISTEKRIELLEKYRAGHVNTEELARLVLVLIEEMEEKSSRLKFSGLRRQVTASELFQAQIIDQETLSKLTHGDKTVEEITEMDTVKRYLEGTGCIAGVLVPARSDPAKTEKMTIYQAMWKGILRPGTALVLLEAQAATGFITDPLENRKLSVDEAVAAGVVGAELREKLLSAERAVTGYKDPYTGSSLSLFQALQKDLIVRDHGVRLLEAQIATGGIIDPIHSHRLPVEVAYQRGFFDEEMNRTLSDPTDDTKGFFDPNTHENLTYNQLLCRCLPDPETGLLMLHLMERSSSSFLLNENTRKALQSAMTRMEVGLFQGQEVSVWDLLFSRYVPPERRGELLRQYKTGTLALEGLTQILTTTILETEGRSHKPDGQQGAPVRPLATSPRESTGHAHGEEAWKELLRSTAVSLNPGEHQGHPMVVWDLLFSDYIWEEKRAELLDMYRRGLLSMDRLINVLTTLVQKKQSTTRKMEVKVKSPHQEVDPGLSSPDGGNWEGALRTHLIRVSLPEFQDRRLSVWDLLYSQYISESQREELLSKYRTGTMTLEELANVLAALLAKATPGKCRHPTSPEAASPDKDAKERSEEDEEEKDRDSVALGEKEEALKSRIVHVVAGELRGQKVSVYHLLYSKYIPKGKRKELLQLYRSGILSTDQMETVVTTIVNKMGEEEEAKEEGPGDASREGTLPEAEGPSLSGPDDQLETALRQVKLNVPVGELQGDQHSLWELLFSKHISTEKRIELLEKYRAGHVNTEELARLVLVLIEEMEEKSSRLKFSGLRRQVTASELFQAQIIDQETLSKLTHGDKTVEEITEMDTVKRYLEGTGCIAGVLVPTRSDPAKTEKMTIYQAMWKGILRPGTALVLLEAQAATGFITDPLENRKLSVDEAVAAGVVGAELREKLLSAERAVTGYKDPYTGSSLSLFQALQKDLIVRDHGVRLLEAQIATGGIIDPIHSHRLPVEVAYQRGFFDEEMNRTLSDPTDDTKGFFDPNTHENLTYNQLLCRCLPDPETGLLMLHLMERSSSSFLLNENTRKALQSAMTRMEVGLFQGQEVSVWDLLFSRYVPPQRRGELLRQYKTGTLALEGLTQILTTTILETEGRSHKPDGQQGAPVRPLAMSPRESTGHAHGEEAWKELLRSTAISLPPGEHQGHPMVVWDLLFSDYIWEEKRAELLDMYRRGLLSMDRLINVLTTLVQKKQSTTRKMEVKVKSPHQEVDPTSPEATSPDKDDKERSEEDEEEKDRDSVALGEKEEALKSRIVHVVAGELRGQKVSVYHLLYSKYMPKGKRKELLQLYRSGILSTDQMETVVTTIVNKMGEEEEAAKEESPVQPGPWEDHLRNHTVVLRIGPFQGQEVSIWDLLFSQNVPEAQREDLLQKYRSGTISLQEMVGSLAPLLSEQEGGPCIRTEVGGAGFRDWTEPTPGSHRQPSAPESESHGKDTSESVDEEEKERDSVALGKKDEALKSRMVHVATGELHGQRISVWHLLQSTYIPNGKQEELLQLYRSGILTTDQMETVVTTIVNKMGGEEEKQEEHVCGVTVMPGESESPTSSYYDLLQHTLRLEKLNVTIREIQGEKASVWDPFFSRCVSNIKKEEILHRHGLPTVSMKESIRSITTLITESEGPSSTSGRTEEILREDLVAPGVTMGSFQIDHQLEGENVLKSRLVDTSVDEFHQQQDSLWGLLHSHYISEEKRNELLHLYTSDMLSLDQIEKEVIAVINKTMNRETKSHIEETESSEKYQNPRLPDSISLEETLQSETFVVPVGELQGQKMSCWELLSSKYISEEKKQELLSQFKAEALSVQDLAGVLSDILIEAASQERDPSMHSGEDSLAEETQGESSEDSHAQQLQLKKSLRTTLVPMSMGEYKGQKVCVLDLLFSKYVPQDKRQELLEAYRAGTLPIQALATTLTSMIEEAESKRKKKKKSCMKGTLCWKDRGDPL